MDRCLGGGQGLGRRLLHAGRRRQGQVQHLGPGRRRRGRPGQAQLAVQPGQQAPQLLALRFAFRGLVRFPRQDQSGVILFPALQHPQLPAPGARMAAVVIQRTGPFQFAGPLPLPRQLETQPVPALPGPRAIRRRRQRRFHLLQGVAHLEPVPAGVQVQVGVHVPPALKRPHALAETHRLVLEGAQVAEHELGPVLIEITEEHQPKAVAQGHQGEVVHRRVRRRLVNVFEFGQRFQPVRLAGRGRHPGGGQRLTQQRAQFRLGEQPEQGRQVQRRGRGQPAVIDQRRGGAEGVADLRVNQFVGPEVFALAHHHAHQQRPGRPGQCAKRRHEGELVVVQQIAMARLYPAQHFLEVVQVVKRVVQSDVGDRGTVHLASIPMDSARSNQSVPVR